MRIFFTALVLFSIGACEAGDIGEDFFPLQIVVDENTICEAQNRPRGWSHDYAPVYRFLMGDTQVWQAQYYCPIAAGLVRMNAYFSPSLPDTMTEEQYRYTKVGPCIVGVEHSIDSFPEEELIRAAFIRTIVDRVKKRNDCGE